MNFQLVDTITTGITSCLDLQLHVLARVPRVRIFISVAKTKSELSRSPLGSWAERPQEVRAEQDGARNRG